MSTGTVKLQYVGRLAKVRMPEGGEYLSKDEAKSPEARVKTVRREQPIRVETKAAEGLCKTKLWKLVGGKNGASKKGGRK